MDSYVLIWIAAFFYALGMGFVMYPFVKKKKERHKGLTLVFYVNLWWAVFLLLLFALAKRETLIAIQWKLLIADLLWVFVTCIMLGVAAQWQRAEEFPMDLQVKREGSEILYEEIVLTSRMVSRLLVSPGMEEAKKLVLLLPYMFTIPIDVDGFYYRQLKHKRLYLSNLGAYHALSDYLVKAGYGVVRMEVRQQYSLEGMEELRRDLAELLEDLKKVYAKELCILAHGQAIELLAGEKLVAPGDTVLLLTDQDFKLSPDLDLRGLVLQLGNGSVTGAPVGLKTITLSKSNFTMRVNVEKPGEFGYPVKIQNRREERLPGLCAKLAETLVAYLDKE